MNHNYFKKALGGAVLGISLLLGIGMSTTTAQAQYRNDDYYRRQQREYEKEQRRYEKEQRKRQRECERQQQHDARNRDYGYRDDGYNDRYGRNNDYYYGVSFQLRQTALNAGYNEGIKEGRKDRRNGNRFDPYDKDAYRRATTDYSSRL